MTPVDFFRVGIVDNFDVMRTRSDARRSGNAQTKGQVLVHGASRAAARLCFVAPRINAIRFTWSVHLVSEQKLSSMKIPLLRTPLTSRPHDIFPQNQK